MDGFKYSIKAIPTKFNGVLMRSRLEARWAAFFTNCGWRWTYEPFDAAGWAPDFVIHLPAGDVYVEVKPMFTPKVRETFISVAEPLVGQEHRAILVSDHIHFEPGDFGDAMIGMGIGRGAFVGGDDIAIGCCTASEMPCLGMSPANADYACWVCGQHEKQHAHSPQEAGIGEKWADACNRTQWRG